LVRVPYIDYNIIVYRGPQIRSSCALKRLYDKIVKYAFTPIIIIKHAHCTIFAQAVSFDITNKVPTNYEFRFVNDNKCVDNVRIQTTIIIL